MSDTRGTGPRCSGCHAPATHVLLMEDGADFTPPLYACEPGARSYSGPKRRVTSGGAVSSIPAAPLASRASAPIDSASRCRASAHGSGRQLSGSRAWNEWDD